METNPRKPKLTDLACRCGCGRILNVWAFRNGTPWRREGPMLEVSWEREGKRPAQPIWLYEDDMEALLIVLQEALHPRRWWQFWR